MRRRQADIIATLGVIIVMFYFVFTYFADVDIDATVGPALFRLLPGFIIIAISIYVTAQTGGMGRLGGMMGTGIGVCYFLNAADLEGLITVEMLSGLTVPQIQIWTMIISTVLGFVLYASN